MHVNVCVWEGRRDAQLLSPQAVWGVSCSGRTGGDGHRQLDTGSRADRQTDGSRSKGWEEDGLFPKSLSVPPHANRRQSLALCRGKVKCAYTRGRMHTGTPPPGPAHITPLQVRCSHSDCYTHAVCTHTGLFIPSCTTLNTPPKYSESLQGVRCSSSSCASCTDGVAQLY